MGRPGAAHVCLEVALALALEAVGDAIDLWEDEGEERFDDEFALSAEQSPRSTTSGGSRTSLGCFTQPRSRTESLHLASPGRTPDGHVTSPISWSDESGSIARLLRGLNDIRYGVPPTTDSGPRT